MESSGSWDLPNHLVETGHFEHKSLPRWEHLIAPSGMQVLHDPTPPLWSAERAASHVARCACPFWFCLNSASVCVVPSGQETRLLIPFADSCMTSDRAIVWHKLSRKRRCQTERQALLCCQNVNGILLPLQTLANFLSGVVADAGKQKGALCGELPSDSPESNQ